jgi:hypothetical protein
VASSSKQKRSGPEDVAIAADLTVAGQKIAINGFIEEAFYQDVHCNVYYPSCHTVTVTSTSTITAATPTSTSTSTSTSVSVSVPESVTSVFTTSTSTTTVFTTPITTVTSTTTNTDYTDTSTSYAACATNNFANYVGSEGIESVEEEDTSAAYNITDDTDPYDCCVSAITDVSSGGALWYFILSANRCINISLSTCSAPQVDGSVAALNIAQASTNILAGNAYCGQWTQSEEV